jgi:hypothetical protein
VMGTTGAGSWNFTGYIGCQSTALPTFGTGQTINVTPPSTAGFQFRVSFTSLNLPASCGANNPIQFWVQRNADTGTSGSAPAMSALTYVIRGN